MNEKRYRIGIDVGLYGIGFSAIEVANDGTPLDILNAHVVAHDSGVDPNSRKTFATRRAAAGVAKRARRLVRQRRRRLRVLDEFLLAHGYPIVDHSEFADPYHPWNARANLAEVFVADEDERRELISVALRHLARHRGWRNPYSKIESLLQPAEDSEFLTSQRERVAQKRPGLPVGELNPAQLVAALNLSPQIKLRGQNGVLGGKLLQSDYANELRQIGQRQRLSEEEVNDFIRIVFAAKSPKGAAAKLAGRDPLPGQRRLPRASKASLAFQRYRIAAVLGNVRITEAGTAEKRPLTAAEFQRLFGFISVAKPKDELDWEVVATKLGIARSQLSGTASADIDGERVSSRLPRNQTAQTLSTCKVKPLASWWKTASNEACEALIAALSNATTLDMDDEQAELVLALLDSLDEKQLTDLDKVRLAPGRAAYSLDSLNRLTDRMVTEGVDLHTARKAEFGVTDDWKPPADPVGAPVGNPAVDRVMKAVNRFVEAARSQWGEPVSINIENIREGFLSASEGEKLRRAQKYRAEKRLAVLKEIQDTFGISGQPNRNEVTRFLAVTRQNSQCLYCGATISSQDAEIDHIVPRAGLGSTNTRDNLVAVCVRCNRAKSNTLFSTWAQTCGIPEVNLDEAIKRVEFWNQDANDVPIADKDGLTVSEVNRLKKGVIARLKRTSADPEFDNRSIESVAWMANELARRLEAAFPHAKVQVFRGQITASARKASGFEGRAGLIGGHKTRLDRRHHAMDAACIALLTPSVAEVLAERENLRIREQLTGIQETWKRYQGRDSEYEFLYRRWLKNMQLLATVFRQKMDEDRVPICRNLRLRLGSSNVHADTIRPFKNQKPLASAFTVAEIDRAGSPALWCALTRLPDFSPEAGLLEDENRRIVVNGKVYTANDSVPLFHSSAAFLAVRNGYAELGNTIHHARIYHIDGKCPSYAMLRVFAVDLQRHRKEDLFNVPIPPQAISMRTADKRLRQAFNEGTATYLGWLVVGDELLLDIRPFKTGLIGEFLTEFPGTTRWTIDGFFAADRLRLRPSHLAAEGLKDDASLASKQTLDQPGWRCYVNPLWSKANPTVIRRDSLGRPRLLTASSLPITWRVQE